jgi:hypothetical protein
MSLKEDGNFEYLIRQINAGSARNNLRWPFRIGRVISLAMGAVGAILLIRRADKRRLVPDKAGSFSKDWRRLIAVGTLLGRYSSSVTFLLALSAGLSDAVGWKYTAGLMNRPRGRPARS